MNYTYKQIWLINLPVMMSVLMEQLINITDAVFLGHVGEVELGASALAGIYYLATYMLGFGFSIGLQVMIARRNGEQNYAETGRTFFQGLFFLSGLALSLCLLIQGLSPFLLKQLISRPLKSAHLRNIVRKQYPADFFNKPQKSPHGSFEVVCGGS